MYGGMESTRKVPIALSAASKTSLPTGATSTRSSKKLRSRRNSVVNQSKNVNYQERMSMVGMNSQAGNSSASARREMAHQQKRARAESKMIEKFNLVDH